MKVKSDEIRKFSEKEIVSKLRELRKNLMKINAQIATGTVPENPSNVKNIKKSIARILTIQSEKRRGEGKK